ncbi:MAG: toll/interleukin-1 receptor domain-containing protein [Pseudomonadota bacterium]
MNKPQNNSKKRVRFFVSYAHRNQQLAESLINKLADHFRSSKSHDYSLWMDSKILAGDEWENKILEARDKCDFGLILVSPSFLGSKFICENELSHFVGSDRTPSIPVMLQTIDFELHDLKGLEALQIFRFKGNRFKEPRAYGECKNIARDDFVLALFQDIERKINI